MLPLCSSHALLHAIIPPLPSLALNGRYSVRETILVATYLLVLQYFTLLHPAVLHLPITISLFSSSSNPCFPSRDMHIVIHVL